MNDERDRKEISARIKIHNESVVRDIKDHSATDSKRTGGQVELK